MFNPKNLKEAYTIAKLRKASLVVENGQPILPTKPLWPAPNKPVVTNWSKPINPQHPPPPMKPIHTFGLLPTPNTPPINQFNTHKANPFTRKLTSKEMEE